MIGIYCIECKINNMKYVGSSVNINERFKSHVRVLKSNKHKNKMLQDDFNKYGVDAFNCFLIEECLERKLIEREQYYIDLYGTYNGQKIASRNGYKKVRKPRESESMLGKKHKAETKKLISNKTKEQIKSNGHPRQKITLEDAFKIKQLLLEDTNESNTAKDKRISKLFNVSNTPIGNIRLGKHPYSSQLGGGLKDWK